jgi:hypothetical protein
MKIAMGHLVLAALLLLIPGRLAAEAGTVITHIGKYDLPRGDKLDLVDLRGGDHCKGTITETSYRIQTPYGVFEVPAQNVAGIISLSPSGTRQLLVTTDGQALAGRLEKLSIAVQLPKEGTGSGEQTMQIPLSDVLHLGYRPRADEHDPSADRATVFLRSGDILALAAPQGTVRIVTRYGAVELPLQRIASMVLDSDENGLHVVRLTDGSHFGAILESDQLPLRLKLLPIVPATRPESGATANGDVRFGPGTISRVIFNSKIDPLDAAPTLKLANDDLLVGTLQGELKLDTSLDTLNVDPARIVHLTRTGDGPQAQLHVSFSDDTQFSGQLESLSVECHLQSGTNLQVPVDQLRDFTRPRVLDKPPATQPAR